MSSQNGAHQAASSSAPLQSRGHKRQFQEEDDHTESLKTKRQNSSTQGSPADEGRGYGKRSAGNKPHRKKTGSKK